MLLAFFLQRRLFTLLKYLSVTHRIGAKFSPRCPTLENTLPLPVIEHSSGIQPVAQSQYRLSYRSSYARICKYLILSTQWKE